MVHVRGVSKRFGRRQVLDGLAADFRTARVTGVVGPNGAGKTTLLKLVLGLASPEAGTISVGRHLLDGTPGYRAQIGYMPQIARFPSHLSGRELLQTLVALRGHAVVPDLSLREEFGLGDEFNRPLGTLSGGTRQKVNAVLAFAFRPQLLILDEPTAGLDPLAARVLKDRIRTVRDAGATVMITSHVLPELEEVADDILFLVGGRAAWQGGMGQLKATTGQSSLEGALATLFANHTDRAVA